MIARGVLAFLIGTLSFCAAAGAAKDVSPCRPTVEVSPKAAEAVHRVDVFWDTSKSLAKSRADLKAIERLLDSTVFPLAKIDEYRHFEVGDTVAPLPTNAQVHFATADWTALNDAAVVMGQRLAGGEVGATILVSDLELEIPAVERSRHDAVACPGVAMPKSQYAGPVFGRCFAHAVRNIADYRVSMFRKAMNGRSDLFILIIARSPAIGEALDRVLRGRVGPRTDLNFSYQLLADTSRFGKHTRVECGLAEEASTDARLSSSAEVSGSCIIHCSDTAGAGVFAMRLYTPGPKILGLRLSSPTVKAREGIDVQDLGNAAYSATVACALKQSNSTSDPSNPGATSTKGSTVMSLATSNTTLRSVTFSLDWRAPDGPPPASSPNAQDLLASLLEAVASSATERTLTVWMAVQ